MEQYKALISHILSTGERKPNRTGIDALSVFGYQMRFDLTQGFPLVTLKHTSFKLVLSELLWFISGNKHISDLHDNGNHIWDEWVKDDGTFGRIYGAQWREWGGEIDQLQNVIDLIKTDPNNRRLIVSAWNPSDTQGMALPPCHCFFQFYVREGEFLDCQMYQRSCDVFLGLPFNIASYALLTKMVSRLTNLRPGHLVWTGGDCHIYGTHLPQTHELLKREPKPLPILTFKDADSIKTIDDFRFNNFNLLGYRAHDKLKGAVAV